MMLRYVLIAVQGWAAAVSMAAGTPEKGTGKETGDLRRAPIVKKEGAGGLLDEFLTRAEPGSDAAWASEAVAEEISGLLKKLGLSAEHAGQPEEEMCAKLAAAEFSCGPVRPAGAALAEVFADASLKVMRGKVEGAAGTETGGAALVRALKEWTAAYPQGTEVHSKFKIVGVDMAADGGAVRITAFAASNGATPAGIAAQTATWVMDWRLPGGEAAPQLLTLAVKDYEEVQPAGSGGPLFEEVTTAVLGKTEAWRKVLTRSLDHWFGTLDAAFQVSLGTHGIAICDVDGDGREDVYLPQPAGLKNILLRRKPDGTCEDISAAAGLDWLDNSRAALFSDLDNDGDPDLVLTLGYGITIFANDGKGRFAYRARADLASWPMSIVASDYDLDGDLDLYLCGYTPREQVNGGDFLANPVPYHDANNGARNFMLRNDGDWHFADVTESSGMEQNNRKFSLAATWEDYDKDGDPDLYVANDFGRNNLYRNDFIKDGKRQPEPKFTDAAAEAGVEDLGPGMSVTWGDYDHDGRMDLYVSNMFSSAGRRVTSQGQFKTEDSEENKEGYRRHARGNSLFRNNGDGTFRDVSLEANVFLGRWAWGSLFTDLNNDSWEDLYVCNGFYTRPDPGDL